MSHVDPNAPADETPNVVVSDPNVRRYLGLSLYLISLLAGLAALYFGIFPETGGDLAGRVLLFVNSAVSFLSGAFGIAVTLPNVPKR
jgi:hypothetical protein